MSTTVTTHDNHHDTAYALAPETARLSAEVATEFRFRILQSDGAPVVSFAEVHEKQVHLIVVRRDLTGYWHLHPSADGDGVWTVLLPVLEPGDYRVFADFSPAESEESFTISADLAVDGEGVARELPAPATRFAIGDYAVELTGSLVPGRPSRLAFSVRRSGQPVTDLQPYLGAYGHLVAVHAADLAYVHVHPDGSPGDGATAAGPDVTFHAHVADPGAYRLFLDFQHGDTVRTAAFTLVAD
ncbi:hypothetical protein K1T35_35645 [Pseudonocardia sp. DSM 110487]|uniref:hypothetical protein n=1 Tax=Pseudonocardia sp. DSM 110487 TaxID=2865833 RepID=UPI001C6A89F6|nr:hypothetical protein [Pseudonocardia sp. DSM 110487]QYN33759.1 hypothetical protein K1T35_35645 [Pseudonocardia sp. DSM 110487]